jgi:cathepsin F
MQLKICILLLLLQLIVADGARE